MNPHGARVEHIDVIAASSPRTDPSRRLCRERGAGSVLGIAIIGGCLAFVMLLAPVFAVYAARQQVALTADAAALAAADAVRGIIPGSPCELAGRTAAANGAELGGCRLEGVIATVRVETSVGAFTVSGVATAGPPASSR